MNQKNDPPTPLLAAARKKRVIKRSTVDGSSYDRAMVSFRSDMHVMEGLKKIALQKGLPYQALLRRVLKDYVDAHKSPG